MTVRALVLGDTERQAAHDLALFAARPENHYVPNQSAFVPGDDPRFRLRLGLREDFRCVFSFTRTPSGLYRHLSISVPSADYPHPIAVTEIARLFGFKGELGDWQVNLNKDEHCIVVAQRIP